MARVCQRSSCLACGLQSSDPSPGGGGPFLTLSLYLLSSAHTVHSDTMCHVSETPDS